MKATEKYGRERLKVVTRQLRKALDDDCPGLLISMIIASIDQYATLAFGEDYTWEKGKIAIAEARRWGGFCQHCETELTPAVTHLPICEHCDARLDTEVDQMTKDAGLDHE